MPFASRANRAAYYSKLIKGLYASGRVDSARLLAARQNLNIARQAIQRHQTSFFNLGKQVHKDSKEMQRASRWIIESRRKAQYHGALVGTIKKIMHQRGKQWRALRESLGNVGN